MNKSEIKDWYLQTHREYSENIRHIETCNELTEDFIKESGRTLERLRVLERVLFFNPKDDSWEK